MPTVRPTLLLALALTACAGPFVPQSECRVYGQGPVFGEGKLDCALVESRFELAKKTLIERGLIPPDKFDVAFTGVTFWIRDSNDPFECEKKHEGPAKNSGCYYVKAREVLTTKDMETILHEMLHHWQLAILQVNPNGSEHLGWAENGYYKADVAFRHVVLGF